MTGVDIQLTMPDPEHDDLNDAYLGARQEADEQELDRWWTSQLTPQPQPTPQGKEGATPGQQPPTSPQPGEPGGRLPVGYPITTTSGVRAEASPAEGEGQGILSTVTGAAKTAFDAVFNPPLAERLMKYVGLEPINIQAEIAADLRASGVRESSIAGLVPVIAGAIENVHGIASPGPRPTPGQTTAASVAKAAPQVGEEAVANLKLDPQRFQYKVQQAEGGSTGSLAGVQTYDPNLAGIIQVWRDPADGATYVVNGHNRVGLAKRQGVESIPVRYLNVQTAEEARTIGALTNVAEGRGSPIDAAKLFRDTGLTRADLEARGIPLREKIATDGLSLANLQDSLFNDVIQGALPLERGVIIGSRIADRDQQLKLVQLLRDEASKGRRVGNDQVRELADFVQSAPSQQVIQETLFGAEETTVSLALDKARIAASIRERLSTDKALFARVGQEKAAQRLTESGAGTINTESAQQLSQEAAMMLEIFDRLKNSKGEISDILNDAAKEIQGGAKIADVTASTYQRLTAALPEALRRAESEGTLGAASRVPTGQPETSTGDVLSAEAARARGAVSEAGIPIREPAPGVTAADESSAALFGAEPPAAPPTTPPAAGDIPPERPFSFAGKRLNPPEQEAAQQLLSGEGMEGMPGRINMGRVRAGTPANTVIETINKLNVESGATAEAVRGVVSHRETIAAARQSGITVQDLLALQPGQVLPNIPLNVQITAARKIHATSGKYVASLAERVAQGDQEAASLIYDAMAVHGTLDAKMMGLRSEPPRATEAMKIPVSPGNDEAIARSIGELADRLRGVTLEATGQPGIPALISPEKLADMIVKAQRVNGQRAVDTMARQAVKPGVRDMLFEAWINGLLTNPQTHAANLLSNSLTAVWAIPERAMAARMHPFTDVGVQKGEATQMLYGFVEGAKDGFSLGAKAFRTGEPQTGLSKLESGRPRAISAETLNWTGLPGRAVDFIGNGFRLPGRALLAGDEFFKAINYRMQLHALAFRQAAMEGLDGQAMGRRIRQIIDDPPASLKAEADDFAAYQTFNKELGEWGTSLMTLADKTPGGRLVLPFIRTPTNIAKYAFERFPGLNLAMGTYRADLKAGGARRDLALAKMASGAMAMAVATTMAAEGLITGGGPANPQQRAIWLRDHQPYSVRFPGGTTWYSYNRLDPIGMLLGTAANVSDIIGQLPTADADQLAMAAVLGAGEALASKTYMKGLADTIDALREPESKGANIVRNWARSIIPAGVANLARQVDPVQRMTRPGQEYTSLGWVDGILTEMQARVPGYSSDLPPRRNLFGEVVQYEGGLGLDLASPIYTKEATDDPASQEILKHRVNLSLPSRVISGPAESASPFAEQDRPREGVPLTPQEYDFLVRLAGNELPLDNPLVGKRVGMHDALNLLVKTPYYQKQSDGPDGGKALLIRKTVQTYRDAARATLLDRDTPLRELVQQKQQERTRAKMPPASAIGIIR